MRHSQPSSFSSAIENVESGSDSDDSATPRQRRKGPASTSRGGGDRRSPQLPSKRARETEREDNRKRMRKSTLTVFMMLKFVYPQCINLSLHCSRENSFISQ